MLHKSESVLFQSICQFLQGILHSSSKVVKLKGLNYSSYPTIHSNCRLLSHLLMHIGCLFANTTNPDQTTPLEAVWSKFIVFASKVKTLRSAFEYMQQTIKHYMQTSFSGLKILAGKGLG